MLRSLQNVVVPAGAILVVALSGCSQKGSSRVAAATSNASTSSNASAKGKSVVYIAPSTNGFYVQANCGAKQVADAAGVNYSVQYAKNFTAADETPLINAAVASKPAAIIVSAADTKALNVPLRQAALQGIKVITVANGISDNSFLTSAVQGDNEANGKKAADLLAKLAAGKSGEVAYIAYTPGGSAVTDARRKGFEAQIKKYSNLKLISPTVLSGLAATDGAAATNAVLSAHPDLLGIVGSYVPVANGMATALKERGAVGKVIALQMDADPAGVEDVKAGTLQGLTAEATRQEGQDAMTQAINAITGKKVDKSVTSNPVVFTKDNASSPDMQQYISKTTC